MLGELISIHAPHEGSDLKPNYLTAKRFKISIHAPHEGSDFPVVSAAMHFYYFNPRSP